MKRFINPLNVIIIGCVLFAMSQFVSVVSSIYSIKFSLTCTDSACNTNTIDIITFVATIISLISIGITIGGSIWYLLRHKARTGLVDGK